VLPFFAAPQDQDRAAIAALAFRNRLGFSRPERLGFSSSSAALVAVVPAGKHRIRFSWALNQDGAATAAMTVH
jgi:hypothetical protein